MTPAEKLTTLLRPATPRWILAVIFVVAWAFVLLVLRRLAFAAVRRILDRSSLLRRFEVLLSALAPAVDVAIVAAGVAVATQFWPTPPRWIADVDIIVTGGFVLALIVFADQLTRLWLHSQAARFPLFGDSYGIVTGAVRGVIYALGLLMFLESVGVSISPILASLGIGSLAIALGLQETVKNMFAGFFVIADRPLVVGDFVKLESGQEGQLIKLGWRSSKFLTLGDGEVVVPNSKLVDSIVTNYRTVDGDIAIEVALAVLSSNDLEQVERVTIEAAREAMKIAYEDRDMPKPGVIFQGVAGNVINLSVLMRVRSSASINQVRHAFIKGALARYQSAGIKTP